MPVNPTQSPDSPQDAPTLKQCGCCGQSKPVSDFYTRAGSKDGYRKNCKECHEQRRAELLADPSRLAAYRSTQKESSKKYNKKRLAEKRYDPVEKARKSQTNKLYRERHKEKLKAEKSAEYERNKARYKKAASAYRANNPGKNRALYAAYRAKKKGGGGGFSEDDWKFLCAITDGRCYCCKKRRPLAADHIIPVSKNGSSNIENIQPLCKSCNSRKGTKDTSYKEKVLTEANKPLGPDPFKSWAVVELMGHARMAGMVTEVELFGNPIGRCDVPDKEDGFTTVYFTGASIYRLTPCTEDAARAVARLAQPEPVHQWELPRQIEAPAQRHVDVYADDRRHENPDDEDDDSRDMEL